MAEQLKTASGNTEKALKDASDEITSLFEQKVSQFNDQTSAVQQSAEDMMFKAKTVGQSITTASDEVTERVGACSYYAISTGMQSGTPQAAPLLTPGSKSVLCTTCSLKKYLIL